MTRNLRLLPAGVVFTVLVSAAGPAAAENELVTLLPANPLNVASVAMTGDGNRLVISQLHFGGDGANAISVSIEGNRNGGPEGAVFSGPAAATGLSPGSLMQSGFGNAIELAVAGDDNLFAVTQSGSGNVAIGAITGFANQAAIVQVGVGNVASFSQNGIGNIVSISQHSW